MENFSTISRLGLSEQVKQTFIFPGLLNSWFTANYKELAAIITLLLSSTLESTTQNKFREVV